MDEQTQAAFLGWLKEKLQIQDDEQLNGALQELGEEGLKQAYQTWQQENANLTKKIGIARNGAKLEFFKQLNQYRSK